MRLFSISMILALTTLTASAVPARAAVDTTRSVSFGDSLTHNDLLHFLFEGNPDLRGADPFEAAFNKAAAEDDDLLSFAVLASTTSDVLDQVQTYVQLRRDGVLPPATLINYQAGGNDILDNLAALASAPPGANRQVDRVTFGIKIRILKALLKLSRIDRRADLVVWTLPDVTQIPLVQAMGLPEAALANVRRHTECINAVIRIFGRTRRVAVLDLYAVLRNTVANPPVLFGMSLIGPPSFGDFDNIFADPIHPTAVGNAILANGIIHAMNHEFRDNIPLYSELELAELAFPWLVF